MRSKLYRLIGLHIMRKDLEPGVIVASAALHGLVALSVALAHFVLLLALVPG